MENQNGIALKTLIIIIAIVIVFLCFIFSGSSGYKLNNEYSLAYSHLNLAITKSALDGTGTIEREYFNKLGTLVKKYKSSSQWFGGYNSIYYGKITNTSDGIITQVSDGTYVATFTIKYKTPNNQMSDYILVDYSFESKYMQGYKFGVN